MIQHQLKLRLNSGQERELERWLVHLASIYNWALSRIGHDAQVGTYYSEVKFRNLLAGTSKRLGVPSQAIQGTLTTLPVTLGFAVGEGWQGNHGSKKLGIC